MKYLLTILLGLLTIPIYCQVDTIFLKDGGVIPGSVLELRDKNLTFTFYNKDGTLFKGKNKTHISNVDKIVYKTGEIEHFTTNLDIPEVFSCLDYDKVYITNEAIDVKNLALIDTIRTMELITNPAKKDIGKLLSNKILLDKLKKESAILGCNIVYIDSDLFENSKNVSINRATHISGSIYTTNEVGIGDLAWGDYKVSCIYLLEPSAGKIIEYDKIEQTVSISRQYLNRNTVGRLAFNFKINSIPDHYEFTATFADKNQVILSGMSTFKRVGPQYHYNVFLERIK